MVTAFAGSVSFLFLNNSARDQEEKIKELIENVAHLRDEKNILEMEIQNLKAQGIRSNLINCLPRRKAFMAKLKRIVRGHPLD